MTRPIMSLFTDASVRHATADTPRIGSWAFWAKFEGHSIHHGAMLKGDPGQVWEAEMKAMANALHYMVTHNFLKPKTHILWQTDSIDAIQRYGKLHGVAPHAVKLLKEHECSLLPRHVRAHMRETNPNFKSRNWVNNLCDKLCREAYDTETLI